MMNRGKFIFVTGAARSGKSCFAERLAAKSSSKVIYIATCVPEDEEMRQRVVRHQARRPDIWQTVEEALNPARVIQESDQQEQVFLLDCLTLLVNNLLFKKDVPLSEEEILEQISELAEVSSAAAATVIIVSNEVGWGIVPADPQTRLYRDIIGRTNQIMASHADEAYITIAGIPVELKVLAQNM